MVPRTRSVTCGAEEVSVGATMQMRACKGTHLTVDPELGAGAKDLDEAPFELLDGRRPHDHHVTLDAICNALQLFVKHGLPQVFH